MPPTPLRLALASLWLTTAAAQQGALHTIVGSVTDPSTSPVPGRAVLLRWDSGERLTETDAFGEFRFEALPAGTYTLDIVVPGFDRIVQQIRTGRRGVVRVAVRLTLARLREEITVPADSGGRGVSTDAAANANAVTLNAGALDILPVLGLDYLGALAKFLDPGAGPGATTLIVDGVEARNAGVTPSAIQEIRINQNPYTAEYPRWSRRRIEVITKAATDRFHGSVNYLMRNRSLNARDVFALERPPEHRNIYEGSVLGPVGSGRRATFLLSGLHEDDRLQAVVFAVDPAGHVRKNVPVPQRNTQASIRLNRHQSDSQSMFWQLNYQDRFVYNQGVGSTILPEAGANYRFREDEFIFNHRYVFSTKLLSQFRILLGRYWAPLRSVINAPQTVVVDAFTGGGAQSDSLRTEVHTSIAWTLAHAAGNHTLKYGINVPDWSRRGFSDYTNRLGTFYFASLADYAAGRPFAAQVQRGNGRIVFIEKNLGGFVQDEWQVRQNLSVSLGVRYDWQNYFHDADNVQPRLAVAWAPKSLRGTVIRAGSGLFHDRSGPGPVADMLRYGGAHLRRYVISDPWQYGTLSEEELAALPFSLVRMDSAVELPYVAQFTAGVERQLWRGATVALTYAGTRGIQQFRSRDVNAPLPPLFASRPTAAVNVLRQIESAGRMEGNAVELTARGTLAPRITGLLQYTYGRTMSNAGGVNWFPANSYDPSGEWGRADTDRRHQFNALVTAKFGAWINLGVSASLTSGAPFNITTGRDNNRDGLPNDRPKGVTRNVGNGPGYASVDLRWAREWELRGSGKEKALKATLMMDAFNLLNHVNYVTYVGALSSPFFGRAVAAHPSRRLQLGARLNF